MTRTFRSNSSLVGAALLVLAGCLAGCSPADAEASPSPTPTTASPPSSEEPTPEPSPSPSVEKPERPEAMERDDAEGAAAAAEYFLELVPYVLVTGDRAEFESMSHAACQYCANVLANEQWLRDTGSVYQGGETQAEISKVYSQDPITSIFPFDARATTERILVTDANGGSVDSVERETLDLRVEVAMGDGGWVIIGIADKPEA